MPRWEHHAQKNDHGHLWRCSVPLPNSPGPPTMSSQAGWDSVTAIATLLFDGNLVAIAIAILFTFGVPVLLHLIFFRSAASPPSSNFLLLGPSGAGKTALTTLVCQHDERSLQVLWLTILYSSKPSPRLLPRRRTLPTLPKHQQWCPRVSPRPSLRPLTVIGLSMTPP